MMKDARGDLIYVGKAANLRNRVRNYFTRTGDTRFSVAFLRRHVTRVEFVVTANEKEAFLLENTLIKKHKPRYNIRLRDDKTYVSLRIRMNHSYPRLEIVRVRNPAEIKSTTKDLYFGPYASAGSVRDTLRYLLKIFPVRTCKDSVFANRTRPCILYDVGKCCGPCVLPVPHDEYNGLVRNVALFLRGKKDEVREALEVRMAEFSERMEFEKAAIVRDRVAAMGRTLEHQQAAAHERTNRDVIGIQSQQGRSMVVIHEYRDGQLTGTKQYYLKNYEQTNPEVLYSVVSQHYSASDPAGIPGEILIAEEPEDYTLLEEWLRDLREGQMSLAVPQRGERAKFVTTASENAHQLLLQRLSGEENTGEALGELAKKLGLPRIPQTIECVDISNIMGVLAVGSMVRFDGILPDKTGYRLYKIRTVQGANDFAMMHEVLQRRFRSDSRTAPTHPDLLLVDGGKGQLNIAVQIIKELGLKDVMLASIAKSRLKTLDSEKLKRKSSLAESFMGSRVSSRASQGSARSNPAIQTTPPLNPLAFSEPNDPSPAVADDETQAAELAADSPIEDPADLTSPFRYRTQERVFLPGRKNPVTFAPNSPALFLVQRIRDEAHRRAISFHKNLRARSNRKSLLDDVPGVGPVRRRALLRHFGSLSALREASVEDIANVRGVTHAVAEAVRHLLHSANAQQTGMDYLSAEDTEN